MQWARQFDVPGATLGSSELSCTFEVGELHILHVTECYDGGVRRAIENIARVHKEASHSLLAVGTHAKRPDDFVHIRELGNGIVGRVLQYRRVLAELKPDIVHAHSSWAGVYTRVLPQKVPVVYQPHCFVFDDPFRSRHEKLAFRFAEQLLSVRASGVVALSPHEERLARSLAVHWEVFRLPNVATIDINNALTASPDPASTVTVSMVGRVARQKDPRFFAAVAREAANLGLKCNFVWIGSGDETLLRELEAAGVRVTGWLDDIDLISALSESTLYFHCAAYEGFPLSVLDAAVLGLPIIARDLPCFSGTPVTTIRTPQEAVEQIKRISYDPDYLRAMLARTSELVDEMNELRHLEALRAIYSNTLYPARTLAPAGE